MKITATTMVRERLANNGRNPANANAGIPVGSDLHLCEMLLNEVDRLRAVIFINGPRWGLTRAEIDNLLDE